MSNALPMKSNKMNGSTVIKVNDTTVMQNLRNLKFSILPLIMGENDREWRQQVLHASSLLAADHIVRGEHQAIPPSDWNQYQEDTEGGRKLPKVASPVKAAASSGRDQNWDVASTTSQPTSVHKKEDEEEDDADDGSPKGDAEEFNYASHIPETRHAVLESFLDRGTKQTEEEKAQEKYSMNLLDQGMKNRRIYVFYNPETKKLIIESQVDALKRTLLSDAVRKSLKNYPHLLRDVGADDVAAMWRAVAKTEQPEPYELLVSGIDRITQFKKTESMDYQTWIMELSEIILQLQAVDFPVTDMMRIGYTLHLLGKDKRYKSIIAEAKQKKWTYDLCLTKFSRAAVDLGDTARSNKAPAKPDSTSHEQNYQDGGRGRGSKQGKGGKGRQNKGKPTGATPEADWKLKEQNLRNELKQAHKKIQCTTETNRGSCANSSCNFMHKSKEEPKREKNGKHSGGANATSEVAICKAKGLCYSFQKGICPRGDTCPYKHEKIHEQHVMDKIVLKNLRPICEAGELVEILENFSGHFGVYAIVESSYITKLPNGDYDRLYRLAMERTLADSIHPSFHFELEQGVQEKFLLHIPKSNGHEACWQTKENLPLQATLDSASSIDMINTTRFFIPGTVRISTVAISTNNPHSAMHTEESGLVAMRTLDPNVFIVRRFHFYDRARRTIISVGKLRDLGFTLKLEGQSTIISKDGKTLLKVKRKITAKNHLDVDEDDYIPEFDVVPEDAFVLPKDLPANSNWDSNVSPIHENALIETQMQEGGLQPTLPASYVDLREQATIQSENIQHFTEKFREEFPELLFDFDEKYVNKTHNLFLHDSLCMNSEHEMLMLSGIGEIQLQNILDLHMKLSHTSLNKCAHMLGITKLRHHNMLRLRCKYCAMGKLKNAPIGAPLPPPKRILFRVYMDGTGPFVESYQDKHKYAMVLFDQFTEFTELLLNKERGPLIEQAKAWMINAAQRQTPYCIVELRCDGLPEQKAEDFRAWCVEQAIDLHIGGPYAHHHQGAVEKPIGTVQAQGRTARIHACMPTTWWAKALNHAKNVKNVVVTARAMADFKPSAITPRTLTPKERWNEHAEPSFAALHANIHVFGCAVRAYVPAPTRAKDQSRAVDAVYLGMEEGGHSVLIISTGKIITARSVECEHNVLPFYEASKLSNTYHVPWLDSRETHSSELQPIQLEPTELPLQHLALAFLALCRLHNWLCRLVV